MQFFHTREMFHFIVVPLIIIIIIKVILSLVKYMRSRNIEALISREIKEIRISVLDFKRFFCFQLRLRQRQTCRGDHPDDRTGLNYTKIVQFKKS